MDQSILSVLVCPICKSNLLLDKKESLLICKADKLGYPIKDGIPVMLPEEAKKMNLDEIKKYG